MTDEPNNTEAVTEEVVEDAVSPLLPKGDAVIDEDAALDAILAGKPVPEPSVVEDNSAADIKEDESIEETAEVDDELLRALRRDGVPQTIIEQISKDPELLTEWATKAMKRQSDVDAYTEKMKALESSANTGDDSPEESDTLEPTSADEESVEGTTPLDALADEIGEEAVEPIREMQQELTELRAQLDEANRRVVMSEVQSAVEQAVPIVLAKWGDITSDQKSKVIDRMSEIGKAQPKTFSSIEELMSVAAKDVLGEPSVTKRSKTPSAPKRIPKQSRPATQEESEDAALDVLLRGGTRDEAQSAFMR